MIRKYYNREPENVAWLYRVNQQGIAICTDPKTALISMGIGISEELDDVESTEADDLIGKPFPRTYDSNLNTLRVIRQIIIASRPKLLIETGVANGKSTNAILQQISNESGAKLISFDVDQRAAEAVTRTELQSKWSFHMLQAKSTKDRQLEIEKVIDREHLVDFWYHDSDHTFSWQYWEYQYAWSRLRPGSILASDDIDWSFAWIRFLSENSHGNSVVLFDGTKFSGFVRKPEHGE